MDWTKLLSYITGTVDQELLQRNEYLITENRILPSKIDGRVCRVGFSPTGNRRLSRRTVLGHSAFIGSRSEIPRTMFEVVSSTAQTSAYIDFQLKSAGASEKIFEPESKGLVHDYASGIPRQINNISTGCLINAATRNQQKITSDLVNETMEEFHLP